MLLNVAVFGIVFLTLSILGLAGWVNNYIYDAKVWWLFFRLVTLVGLIGFSFCFIATVVLLITGG